MPAVGETWRINHTKGQFIVTIKKVDGPFVVGELDIGGEFEFRASLVEWVERVPVSKR